MDTGARFFALEMTAPGRIRKVVKMFITVMVAVAVILEVVVVLVVEVVVIVIVV